jgi:hypothetical protein
MSKVTNANESFGACVVHDVELDQAAFGGPQLVAEQHRVLPNRARVGYRKSNAQWLRVPQADAFQQRQ